MLNKFLGEFFVFVFVNCIFAFDTRHSFKWISYCNHQKSLIKDTEHGMNFIWCHQHF